MSLKNICSILTLFLSCSCNPAHMLNLSVDPAFNACSLREGKLVFWGITELGEPWGIKTARYLSAVAGKRLAKK